MLTRSAKAYLEPFFANKSCFFPLDQHHLFDLALHDKHDFTGLAVCDGKGHSIHH